MIVLDDIELLHQTDEAYKIAGTYRDARYTLWAPKSVCNLDEYCGTLKMPIWLWNDKVDRNDFW